MTEAKARQRLKNYTQAFDTNRQAATKIGISATMLSEVLRGNRGVSRQIAEAIGLKLVVKTMRSYVEAA